MGSAFPEALVLLRVWIERKKKGCVRMEREAKRVPAGKREASAVRGGVCAAQAVWATALHLVGFGCPF
jgi:hypothetical protein